MTKSSQDKDNKPHGLAKYRSLIVLATSFFGLVMVLSGATYFVSQKIADSTKELEIASQQTVLVQQLSKNLLDLNLYLRDIEEKNKSSLPIPAPTLATGALTASESVAQGQTQGVPMMDTAQSPTTNPSMPTTPTAESTTTNVAVPPVQTTKPNEAYSVDLLPQVGIYQLQELSSQTKAFTDVLNALKNGGTIQDVQGNEIQVSAVTDPELQKTLSNIETIWTPFLGLLNNFVQDTTKGVIKKQTSDYLVDYSRLYNLTLQAETLQFSARQNDLIQHIANQLRLGQIGGVIAAFLLFVAIVFGSLRQLMNTDRQLAIAKRQTDDIMSTVNEGLFLIDKNLVVADQYSAKLESILNKKHIAGKTLYDVLEGMISKKDMDTTKLFVEQLYNTWVVEELIQDLNPLKQVLLSYIDDNGISATKFLEFNFLRVLDTANETVDNVFVSVTDITSEISLQVQMQKDKEQHNRQIEMISYLLSVDGTQLAYFMTETKARIERMNDILRNRDTGNLKEKAESLHREMHSLKGDASAVHLSALVDIANRQEDKLRQLLQQTNLKGNDFLSFTVGLDEMVSMVSFIDSLLQRLNLQGAVQSVIQGGMGQPYLGEQTNQNEVPVSTTSQNDAKNDAMALSQSFDKSNLTNDEVVVAELDFGESAPKKGHWQSYFENYAHDIAERQNKSVHLTVKGFDGLTASDDRFSVYKDMAMQLLKNAIVHGIESKEVRIASDKKAVGEIHLSVIDGGDTQTVEIYDDGAGINWEKIRQKAVAMGQYSEEESHKLVHKDLLRLMFSSGLSTAEKQDEDAGRGVGMDIVKSLASEYHAKIGINSRHAQFTKISITFPKES